MKSFRAVAAFRKLLANKRIDFVLLFGGQAGAAVVPIAEKSEIPTITITATCGIVEDNRYGMRHWLDSQIQSKTLLAAIKQDQIKTAALLLTAHDATLDLGSKFRLNAREHDIDVIIQGGFSPPDRDFRSQILQIRKLDPDAIVIGLMPGHLSAFFRQLYELKVDTPCYGFSTSEDSSELESAGEAMEGLIYVGPDHDELFIDHCRKKFGAYPEGASGNAYDIVMMLKGALVAGATDRGSLNSYLHSIKGFSGSMGHYDLSPEDYFTLPALPPQTPYLTVKAESLLAKSASSGLFVPRDSGSITCLYIIVVFRSL